MFNFCKSQFRYKFPPFRLWKVFKGKTHLGFNFDVNFASSSLENESLMDFLLLDLLKKILAKPKLIMHQIQICRKRKICIILNLPKRSSRTRQFHSFWRCSKGKIWFVEDFLSTNWIHFLLIHLSHFSNIINQFHPNYSAKLRLSIAIDAYFCLLHHDMNNVKIRTDLDDKFKRRNN